MRLFTEQDLLEAKSLNRLDELYVHVSWCFWHEGIILYDSGYPGFIIDVNNLRDQCVGAQRHNNYAQQLIKNSTNNELRVVLAKIQPQIESEHHLSVHFRWVAYHEGRRSEFLSNLEERNFAAIRTLYHGCQEHNPNARSLLCCVNNAYIEGMIDAL